MPRWSGSRKTWMAGLVIIQVEMVLCSPRALRCKSFSNALPRIRRRACLGNPRRMDSDIWQVVVSIQVDRLMVGEIKMALEWGFLEVFRTQVVVTTVCATGCVHTSCRTHISLVQSVEQFILIHFLRVCAHTHCSRMWKRYEQCTSRDTPSRLLPSDVSPICSAAFWLPLWHRAPVSHIHGTLARFIQTQKRGSGAQPKQWGWLWLHGQLAPLHSTWAQPARQDGSCGWWPDAQQRTRPRQYLWLLKNNTREHLMVRCSNSVWKSIPNRRLSRVETAIYLRIKSLETGQRKQRRRSLETKTREWKLTSTSHWKQRQGGGKKKWKSCWYCKDFNASLFGERLPVLTEGAGRYGFINRRVGLGKDEHTDVGIIRVIFNESSCSSWTEGCWDQQNVHERVCGRDQVFVQHYSEIGAWRDSECRGHWQWWSIIKRAIAKVHVFSDSVSCFRKFPESAEAAERWKG